MCTLLGYRGHQGVEATEGAAALGMAHELHPDLVLTDVLMPGMDGYELAKELRAAPDTAATPIMFYTANYLDEETQPFVEAYGVARVLHKPASAEVLLQAIDEVLGQPAAPARPMDAEQFSRQHRRVVNAKLAEKAQALSDTEARFRAMAECAPVGVFSGTATASVVYVNPRLAQVMGMPVADLLELGWLACFAPEQHRDVLERVRSPAEGERRYHHQVTLPDGTHRWLNVQLQTMRDDSGVPSGFVGTVDDVTMMVAAEQRLRLEERRRDLEARNRASERLQSLTRFAGGVAHDFNNLLGVVLNFEAFVSETLNDLTGSGRLDEEAGQGLLADLASIRKAGTRAADLTAQLLTFGSRKVLDLVVVDIGQAVREMTELLARTLGDDVRVVMSVEPGLRSVLAEPGKVTQVLLNVTMNARDAMPDGGTLTVSVENCQLTEDQVTGLGPGEYVRLLIRDTGCGMTAETLDRAVEPFFTTRSSGQGSGLGLATVYGVVNQLGGHLAIESSPGQGTLVTIHLPATDDTVEAPVAPEPIPQGGTETVLLVDDEDGVREAAARTLRRAGYTVLEAAGGSEALTVAAEHQSEPLDLLLSDVMMPGMLGSELAVLMQQQRPGLPTIFMSGYAGDLMNERGRLEPGVTVVSKPFTDASLLQAVHIAFATVVRPDAVTQEVAAS